MGDPRIEVLLSTYNGQHYLHEQIDSILGQGDVSVSLTVRDDGSTDRTPDILASYQAAPGFHSQQGTNLGLPSAFFELIQGSADEVDYWALADQDDVWMPNKLARAVERLEGHAEPSMYCARVLVVDERLQPLYAQPIPRRGPSFANALVQNIATGCTIVVNRPARQILRDRWPTYAPMHDAWIYLVISGTGTVIYDSTIVVRYRQHARNAVGVGRGRLSRFHRRVARQLSPLGPGAHGRANACLAETHADVLTPGAAQQLENFLASRISFRRRLAYATHGAAHRQTRGSDLVLKGLQMVDRV